MRSCQPEEISVPKQITKMALRFSDKLDIYRRLKGLTISEMAHQIKSDPKHLEYLLTGKHQPKPSEALRMMDIFQIKFEPEDFEEEGLI